MQKQELNRTRQVEDAVAKELDLGGGGFDTMVVAEYVNADFEHAARAFQFANADSRHEVTKLVSWCIRNNRLLRLVPYALYQ